MGSATPASGIAHGVRVSRRWHIVVLSTLTSVSLPCAGHDVHEIR